MDAIDRFFRCADTRPDAPAVVMAGRVTSYAELRSRVCGLAAAFAVRPAPRVLIALPRGVDALASVFATGLAGGFHTPLNPDSPTAKLRRIARLLDPDVVAGSGELWNLLQAEAPRAIHVDPAAPLPPALAHPPARHRLAYVIFTSGSTGEPKGVAVPRAGLDAYVDWLESWGVGPGDRLSQFATLAFDISVSDTYAALCYGGALHLVTTEGDRLTPARFIRREGITVWNSVPSAVSLMMQARQAVAANLAGVRLFNFCGEALLPGQLQALFAAAPCARVQNTYGPTEATVAVTLQPLQAATWRERCEASAALGDPLPGMQVVLRGGAHADEGEIVIAGPQLAEGYWNDPAATAAAFREVEVDGRTLRGFHTGDRAERRGGRLYFRGRMDSQVKLRGHRLELEEVAAAIRAAGWPVAVVVKRGEGLVAVVERTPGRPFDAAALRADVAGRIEAWAVPATLLEIARMPRNENDKLDRAAVAAWVEQATARGV